MYFYQLLDRYAKDENLKDENLIKGVKNMQKHPIYGMLPLLGRGIFHCTDVPTLYRSLDRGSVTFDDDPYENVYGKDKIENCYGRVHKYVCLFDFEAADERILLITSCDWMPFFNKFRPITIVLQFDKGELADCFIPNNDNWFQERRLAISGVEAWYPNAIPVDRVQKYIIVGHPDLSDNSNFSFFCVFDRTQKDIFLMCVEGLCHALSSQQNDDPETSHGQNETDEELKT